MEKEKTKKRKRISGDGDGEAADQDLYFRGISAFFVETGIQPKRLQIWKQKLQQLGAVLEERWSKHLTHIFASNVETLTEKLGSHKLGKRKMHFLKYTWIEECLKAGKCLPITEAYVLKIPSEGEPLSQTSIEDSQVRSSQTQQELGSQKSSDWMHIIKEGGKMGVVPSRAKTTRKKEGGLLDSEGEFSEKESSMEDEGNELPTTEISSAKDDHLEPAAGYAPPNLNAHITGPFSEIRDIYKEALGDDRRYFSYYKALSVLEKVPFKITSVDQIKGLPAIGKSLRDSIQEILSTGKLLKLEHLKNDEKVRVIGQFGSVWGIGPVTAQKLYDKGHRSLEDLKGDPSLTPPQRYGLKFHYDIIKKIPRHEIKVMEALVQKAAAELRPGISLICGGSYRRGKAESSDMDFVITHPDGHSHTGFLVELIRKLKEEDFLTEDLKIVIDHSTEGTDHGVDTYFGLCKFPGREQRHRIDFKAYPFDQYPFGLLAWTGNDVLNRRLRLLADSKGYKLDDHGLYPVITDANGGKVKSPVSVPCKSEREVFEKLGFPWLEPHERNL